MALFNSGSWYEYTSVPPSFRTHRRWWWDRGWGYARPPSAGPGSDDSPTCWLGRRWTTPVTSSRRYSHARRQRRRTQNFWKNKNNSNSEIVLINMAIKFITTRGSREHTASIVTAWPVLWLHGEYRDCKASPATTRRVLRLHGEYCAYTASIVTARRVLRLYGEYSNYTASIVTSRRVLWLHCVSVLSPHGGYTQLKLCPSLRRTAQQKCITNRCKYERLLRMYVDDGPMQGCKNCG